MKLKIIKDIKDITFNILDFCSLSNKIIINNMTGIKKIALSDRPIIFAKNNVVKKIISFMFASYNKYSTGIIKCQGE